MAYLWIELTKGLMPGNDRLLGNSPTDDELKNAELCAICHCEFVAPIKLKCGHIFCTQVWLFDWFALINWHSQDIQTWLDKKVVIFTILHYFNDYSFSVIFHTIINLIKILSRPLVQFVVRQSKTKMLTNTVLIKLPILLIFSSIYSKV